MNETKTCEWCRDAVASGWTYCDATCSRLARNYSQRHPVEPEIGPRLKYAIREAERQYNGDGYRD